MWTSIGVCVVLIAGICVNNAQDDLPDAKDVWIGPVNTAALVGSTVTLTCQGTSGARISWAEYVTGVPSGEPISDGAYILPGYPDQTKYQIRNNVTDTYDLVIPKSVLTDGGLYRCTDTKVSDHYFAKIVMIATNPSCISTIPGDGSIVDWQYYYIQCTVDYQGPVAPIMTWTGPGIVNTQSTTSNTTVWSKVDVRATGSMMGAQIQCKTYFTADGFGGTDTASNAPAWQYVYTTPVLNVSPAPVSGVTYVRWGRTVCGDLADVVYKGYAGGNDLIGTNYWGGGSAYLCVPENLTWNNTFTGYTNYGSDLNVVEYDLSGNSPFSTVNNGGVSLQGYDAPCITCVTNRTTHLMIPGMTSCPADWTLEYRGYLVAEIYSTQYRSAWVCLDSAPEVVAGTAANIASNSVFSVVEVTCSASTTVGKPCTNGWEMACVVCTK